MREKTNDKYTHIKHEFKNYSLEKTKKRVMEFYSQMNARRSVRDFSKRSVPKSVIEHLIQTASTAPSGANRQPWTFCAISNIEIKKMIREAAEKEERENYKNRMNEEWIDALKPLGTNWEKSFLEDAPWLIIVFKQIYGVDKDKRKNNYYVNESVGIACGTLITAIHNAGLVTLTHTPSPMNFLIKILNRPKNEKPFLILPVGYPKDDVLVPLFQKKSLKEVSVFYE